MIRYSLDKLNEIRREREGIKRTKNEDRFGTHRVQLGITNTPRMRWISLPTVATP